MTFDKSRKNQGRFVLGTWIAAVPDEVQAAFWEGLLLLIVGLVGLAARMPLLLASLGPTAYEQTEMPHLRSSRPYNVIVGHMAGLAAGFLAIALLHAWNAPKVLAAGQLTSARVWACVIAAAMTSFVTLVLRASQPAALATTLLVALGSLQTKHDALVITGAVLLIAAIGEPVRRLRLAKRTISSGQTGISMLRATRSP
jgi:acid phosphatase family membrane protein YuiD